MMKRSQVQCSFGPQSFIDRSMSGSNLNGSMFAKICDQSCSLYSTNLLAHYGCVNAVEFSNDGTLFASGGDDRRVLLWKVSEVLNDKPHSLPAVMEAEHRSNLFCLSFSHDNARIFSGGNDEQVIVHDTSSKSRKPIDYFLHEKPVYSVSLSSDCNSIFATACDDGKIRTFDIRQPCSSGSPSIALAEKDAPFHSVMFHPVDNRIVASANSQYGVELWDVREPNKCLVRYPSKKGAMSVRFNYSGSRLLCLRRKENPIVYELHHQENKGIELADEGYINSCTMKSCTFAGSGDEFAISGSDDYNIYVWKMPSDNFDTTVQAHMILKGHRSIVNHIRYNPLTCCLASSGVEKVIKFWSSSRFPNSVGGLTDDGSTRDKFSTDFIRRMYPSNQFMTRTTSGQRSTEEDTNMLAFFDLLVERERAGWSSMDDSEDSESDDDHSNEFMFDTSSSSSSSSSSYSYDEESSFSSTSAEGDGAVAGPSGWNPSTTIQIGPHLMSLVETSSDEEQRTPLPTPSNQRETDPLQFRTVDRRKKQYRQRRSSASSSSSSS